MPKKTQPKPDNNLMAGGKAQETGRARASDTIIYRATRKLTPDEFDLLSDVVRLEAEKSGHKGKVLLVPITCEAEAGDSGD